MRNSGTKLPEEPECSSSHHILGLQDPPPPPPPAFVDDASDPTAMRIHELLSMPDIFHGDDEASFAELLHLMQQEEIGLNMVSKDLYTVEVTEANLLSESRQFVTDILNGIFERAIEMDKIEKNSPRSNMLKGYLMATLFYEPSTSTRLSFEPAIKSCQTAASTAIILFYKCWDDQGQHPTQVFYVGKFASSLELQGKKYWKPQRIMMT
ncbi:Aspartate carbamoyltransferase [Musa troglodytarum]|uniref:Aspartate carbamoyltransferase n=1 Tax=Musa troglodytarum TaxID=320322 RepID=A0A9E7FHB4_9LILI|nr:Aspartate carbamoyltransferase [Musa troglodytarum]